MLKSRSSDTCFNEPFTVVLGTVKVNLLSGMLSRQLGINLAEVDEYPEPAGVESSQHVSKAGNMPLNSATSAHREASTAAHSECSTECSTSTMVSGCSRPSSNFAGGLHVPVSHRSGVHKSQRRLFGDSCTKKQISAFLETATELVKGRFSQDWGYDVTLDQPSHGSTWEYFKLEKTPTKLRDL